MVDTRFFRNNGPLSLEKILSALNGLAEHAGPADRIIEDIAPLDKAGPEDISFLDNIKYIEQFKKSKAGICFVRAKYADKAPEGMVVLVSDDPYRAYACTAQLFYPDSTYVNVVMKENHSQDIAQDVMLGQGVVIGDKVRIGKGCSVGHNTVIMDGVEIGENTHIGPLCCISHAIIGSHVIIHRNVNIGQDGFGFAMSAKGHLKVPQLGRVVIEDHVDIGAGTCIDRGAGPDTYIGAGAKIDNLVQIGHNVRIGAGAVIVSQVGIAGSSQIGDGAILAGQVGIAGHLHIGAGAQLAAQAGVMRDIPAGGKYAGSPAVSVKDWHRQTLALNRLIKPVKRKEMEKEND